MKHVVLTLGFFGFALLTACETSDNSVDKEIQIKEVKAEDHAHDENGEHIENVQENHELELNNGEKWEVNEEMKPYVLKGQELLTNYLDSGNEDYNRLAHDIADQNKMLISNCTMDGKSHDELHKWLVPHLKLTEGLMTTDGMDQVNYNLNQLVLSYDTFHEYFE